MTSEVETLEGKEATPTSEEKGAESTLPKAEPTTRTYSQRELDEAVGKGRASTQSQLSLQKAAAEASKAEAEQYKANMAVLEADIHDLRRQHDDLVERQFAEDPEARQAYVDRRTIAEDRRKLAKEKADIEKKLYDAEKLAWSAGMARKADALVKETGIDPAELEACQTEEEMEVKALRFKMTQGPAKPPEEEKFDSGKNSGTGKSFKDMDADQRLVAGFNKLK